LGKRSGREADGASGRFSPRREFSEASRDAAESEASEGRDAARTVGQLRKEVVAMGKRMFRTLFAAFLVIALLAAFAVKAN
jgi:hypothetical protein